MSQFFDVAKILVPKIPLILKTALLNILSLSEASKKWDLQTDLIVTVLRLILTYPHPPSITAQQEGSLKDPGVKGKMWVSKVEMPAPEDAVRQLLFTAIQDLKEGGEEYTPPALEPVEAEWNGYRANVSDTEPEPGMSEPEKYENLTKEATTNVTLLYFHGGSLYLQDPCVMRSLTSKYARLTGGRVFSVRYRLAPQNPFPAALLDALVAYLSLLYPPPGASHKPIPASHIIFTGDSAGGNISLSLLQTLLQIHRSNPNNNPPTIPFHGKRAPIPLPGGLALNSPSLDLTRSLPSTQTNAHYDFLPPPYIDTKIKPPHCAIWPSDPPRADIYCEGSILRHPLVSPLTAKSWEGAPPTFIVCGEEMLTDEAKVFAQRAAGQRVKIVWQQYEAMPHCFSLVLEGNAGGEMCFSSWAEFCKKVVRAPDEIETEGVFVAAKSLERTPVDVSRLTVLEDEEIERLMRNSQRRMIDFIDE
ncbi:hypothetical protein FQN54_006756 [Arachnomyces sp. PD_36]|nr:hypothetical protein FQN54_006756 [Arachnomyces sp. PD_36]